MPNLSLKEKTRIVQKAVDSHEKHEKTQEDEGFTFEQVCQIFRAFLCLIVAIPAVGFSA